MADKIYEYKDENDWFIGDMSGHNSLSYLGDEHGIDDSLFNLNRLLDGLLEIDVLSEEEWRHPRGYRVTVVKWTSEMKLINFVFDMVNQQFGRRLETRQHQGAILLLEDDRLLAVHLPQGGVSASDFFGKNQSTFGDKLLIATHNEGKVKEFRKMFASLGIEVESLADYPDLPEVEETGMTFEENARLKAETISKLTGRMVLADDSGLKVDALGGLPGVWSARFSAPNPTDAKNNAKLLHELAMVFEQKDRSAQFHSTLVVAAPNKESLVVAADWPGYIAYEAKGEGGFGYDPLFLVGETGQTAAQLSPEQKNDISHRGLAMKKLMEAFPAWQNKH
ncbi:nucleoside-triphosphate diphosphatase [Streptococcus halotolerans]|uniref:nucleoside-triphosphate diphosphatase n=1 Tax=Streptococcus halotolerans TaxID=1814128 RepID=UPI000788FEE0|nr:nucleoside-triphosphate diphosphatase [Streptococcus halotolerans]